MQTNRSLDPNADEIEWVLKYLQTHDAVCPGCRYNLHKLTVPRCPECGREVRLMVGLIEQPWGAYLTLLVGLAMPAGLGVLAMFEIVLDGFQHRAPFWVYATSIMAILMVATLFLRPLMMRWPTFVLAQLAGAVWL